MMKRLVILISTLPLWLTACATDPTHYSYQPPPLSPPVSEPVIATQGNLSAPGGTTADGRQCEIRNTGFVCEGNAPRRTPSRAASPSYSRQYYTGPRGGCYYLTASGNKEYVDHSLCR